MRVRISAWTPLGTIRSTVEAGEIDESELEKLKEMLYDPNLERLTLEQTDGGGQVFLTGQVLSDTIFEVEVLEPGNGD